VKKIGNEWETEKGKWLQNCQCKRRWIKISTIDACMGLAVGGDKSCKLGGTSILSEKKKGSGRA
jgi:hypothetical protein